MIFIKYIKQVLGFQVMRKWLNFEKFFAIIGVISTIVGAIIGIMQLYDHFFDGIKTYSDEIAINDFRNEKFLDFLRTNNGNIIYLDSRVDLSPATLLHIETLNRCNNAYPDVFGDNELLDGFVYNRVIVLPVLENLNVDGRCFSRNTIWIENRGDKAELSYGGTGVVTFILRGFFQIDERYYSGSERRFYLKPLAADAETLSNM